MDWRAVPFWVGQAGLGMRNGWRTGPHALCTPAPFYSLPDSLDGTGGCTLPGMEDGCHQDSTWVSYSVGPATSDGEIPTSTTRPTTMPHYRTRLPPTTICRIPGLEGTYRLEELHSVWVVSRRQLWSWNRLGRHHLGPGSMEVACHEGRRKVSRCSGGAVMGVEIEHSIRDLFITIYGT